MGTAHQRWAVSSKKRSDNGEIIKRTPKHPQGVIRLLLSSITFWCAPRKNPKDDHQILSLSNYPASTDRHVQTRPSHQNTCIDASAARWTEGRRGRGNSLLAGVARPSSPPASDGCETAPANRRRILRGVSNATRRAAVVNDGEWRPAAATLFSIFALWRGGGASPFEMSILCWCGGQRLSLSRATTSADIESKVQLNKQKPGGGRAQKYGRGTALDAPGRVYGDRLDLEEDGRPAGGMSEAAR